MANVDRPSGLKPVRHKSGAPYNGAANPYFIPSGYATALYVGDPVVKLTLIEPIRSRLLPVPIPRFPVGPDETAPPELEFIFRTLVQLRIDVEDLRRKADDRVACLMLTNPNTLGIFDANIAEIARIVHDVGATLYYDGANLNAIMGKVRPGDMGFDIVHINTHKTFATPHGGGGPGAGPVAVNDKLTPFLPAPLIESGRFLQRTDAAPVRAASPVPFRPAAIRGSA
mgnify:CR=1 FL=1